MNETVGLPQICFALSSPSSLAMADGPIGGDWGWGDGFWVGQGCLTVFFCTMTALLAGISKVLTLNQLGSKCSE